MYEEWKRLYELGCTLRMIADKFGTNHHFVKRRLIEMGVEITHVERIRKPFSEETLQKMSNASKGRTSYWKGKKQPREMLYKNMQVHLGRKIELEFLRQFDDIEKLKCLNKMLTRERVGSHFDDEQYKAFIQKFYYDEQFNQQFEIFTQSGNRYDRPSLDHIIPLSRGGTWDLDNLQILSWFENHAKNDLLPEEYEIMKQKYWQAKKAQELFDSTAIECEVIG